MIGWSLTIFDSLIGSFKIQVFHPTFKKASGLILDSKCDDQFRCYCSIFSLIASLFLFKSMLMFVFPQSIWSHSWTNGTTFALSKYLNFYRWEDSHSLNWSLLAIEEIFSVFVWSLQDRCSLKMVSKWFKHFHISIGQGFRSRVDDFWLYLSDIE